MEQPIEFVNLINHPNYEILNIYPYTIRRKSNHHELKPTLDSKGYYSVTLHDADGRHKCSIHRLIALQFIPNPDNLPEVDHDNHIRTDNRIENLYWKSASDNNFNKSSHKGVQYEFIDNIPNKAIVIDHYDTKNGRRLFTKGRYYYYRNNETNEDIFYAKVSDNLYRIMYINESKTGKKYIHVNDINKVSISMRIERFKYQYDLL